MEASPLRSVKACITQYNRSVFKLLNQMMKATIVNIGGLAVPSDDASEIVQYKAEFASNYPSMVGQSLLAYLAVAFALSERMK